MTAFCISLLAVSHFFVLIITLLSRSSFFFFNDTATTEIYTLSLHDALPISGALDTVDCAQRVARCRAPAAAVVAQDRKSTSLNSSHDQISYAVFCLKKKKTHINKHMI